MLRPKNKKLFSFCLLLSIVSLGAFVADAQRPKKKPAAQPAAVKTAPKTADAPAPVVRAVRNTVQRIGVVKPKATLGDVPESQVADAVTNTFYELMKSKSVEVVAIEARLPIQVAPEAEEKNVGYILYSTLSQKKGKGDGGLFGRMTGRVANSVAARVPYGRGVGGEIAVAAASETLRTVSMLANSIKAKDELTLEYKLVRVSDSQAVISKSVTAKAKENGEDIITGLIETAANEVLSNVATSAGSVRAENSAPAAAPRAAAPTSNAIIPFIKVMNEAFVNDYVGQSIRTKVRFVSSGQARNWVFSTIPPSAMNGRMAFQVFDEATGSSESNIGSVLPHVFIDKQNADLVFELKKGESLILTGSPVVGSTPIGNGTNYTQIIFVATSIERAK